MSDKQLQSFSLYFDTKENEDHSMSAKELGSSLMALERAISQADKIVNGELSTVSVKAKAFEEGSVGIPILVEFFNNSTDVVELLGLSVGKGAVVGAATAAVSATVIDVISFVKNRKISNVLRKDNGKSVITVVKGKKSEDYEVDTNVERIVTDQDARKSLQEALLDPIYNKTDAKVVIKDIDGDSIFKTLEADTVKNFKKLPRTTLLTEKELIKKIHVRFITINFEKANGWVIKHLNNTYTVKIEDEGFLSRNKANETTFKSGDLFEVILKTIIKSHPDRANVESRYITEVIRKIG